MIYIASADVRPPTTLGAETPGMNLLFIESVSKETKICETLVLSSLIIFSKSCPACVKYLD